MNKTKYLTIRVTDEELKRMKGIAKESGYCLSEWVLARIFHETDVKIKKNPIRREIEKITEEVKQVSVVDILKKDLEINPNRRCCSPNCQSTNTVAYLRGSGTFWLCDTHKP